MNTNKITLKRPFIVEGTELVLGQTYRLTSAQRLVIRDYADFYPGEEIQCIDTGCEEGIVAVDRPEWTSEGWQLPGEWAWQEHIPPAFSDSLRGRHHRTVRMDFEQLCNIAKQERYVEFERQQAAKERAKKERAAKRASKGRKSTSSTKRATSRPKVDLSLVV